MNWRIADVRAFDHHLYVLELHRGEGDEAEAAYVDVQCWDDVRRDRHCLALIGADRDAASQSAAAWVDAHDEEQLATLVLGWHLRRAS